MCNTSCFLFNDLASMFLTVLLNQRFSKYSSIIIYFCSPCKPCGVNGYSITTLGVAAVVSRASIFFFLYRVELLTPHPTGIKSCPSFRLVTNQS